MRDEEIFKLSVITTIIGLIGLIITFTFVTPEQLTINKIDNSKIDNYVEISGTVSSYTITKSNTKIIKITDNTGSINVVIFPSTEINMELSEGESIQLTGKVTSYNGQLELILDDPTKIHRN
ncbi:OB-fold nucleic acid binding domain-containing protein [uncultured Methanosphaera sp.]|uniref:OB-fold nucleic acid binding domain-containing protein n=1 Tax=uncultured Methanosphaera sp. TaxID=262501 RepID=UPI000DC2AF87|nr:OB-fold nucleic acid binding domain-containing protein [uncultured Methanosphaera sp.]RAP44399.1 MAG: hypothetical protein BZ134_03585 [Methanosphaera sp. SHI1033]